MPLKAGINRTGSLSERPPKPATLYKSFSTPVGACGRVADHARKAIFCRSPQKCIAEKRIEAKLRLAGAPWKHLVLGLEDTRVVEEDQRCNLFYTLLHICTRMSLWCPSWLCCTEEYIDSWNEYAGSYVHWCFSHVPGGCSNRLGLESLSSLVLSYFKWFFNVFK